MMKKLMAGAMWLKDMYMCCMCSSYRIKFSDMLSAA